ncbi:hypothetical protein HHK36_025628 [Tetracentron sinense]|uniref:PGG domain-containing protein n=1 Tax=Tetracentron sinense TaxID=13715 RepID=A0A834YJ38_TETSI|nr:hypothetical protein HHK36_025628 [Tetracentron sinense]
MDRRLHEAALRGDVPAFLDLVREDGNIVGQKIAGSLNTVLHLAAKFGHLELASEIVQLSPKMVSAENGRMETPLYEACLEGHVDIVMLLLEKDPSVAYKVNLHNESAMLVACARGQFIVVKHLLSYPRLLMLEDNQLTTPLHAAVFAGHTDIVKEILAARPDFMWKRDFQGCSPLHLACNKGHLEITRELLRLDPDLSSLQDNDTRTPLHWAAMKGHVSILDEILSTSLDSAYMLTKQGETVLHLAVKNNQYDAIKYLVETLNITKLVNMPDNDGNTILHLGTAGKLITMVTYLVNKTSIDVNAVNNAGFTALDVVEYDVSNSKAPQLRLTLQEAGCKRCNQLPLGSPKIQRIRVQRNPNDPYPGSMKIIMSSPTNSHRKCREKQHELHQQGLRNARNTIIVLAVLIATVTFGAGISPPGGVNQETGKAIMGREIAFKFFTVCNTSAFFFSLGIVIVLVSIIPFQRKSMMKILVATHKVMWVSVSFMAAGYIAAMWLIIPPGKGTRWLLVAIVSIGGGCLTIIFGGLGVMLAGHRLRKLEWKREKGKKKKRSPKTGHERKSSHESINSDLESAEGNGFHPF